MDQKTSARTRGIPLDPAPAAVTETHRELATLAKALGHPVRVAILALLRRRGSCICGDIVDELPVAQATVSQHLKVLKEAGFIKGEIDGPRVCYCENPAALRRLGDLLAAISGAPNGGREE